MPDGCEEAAAVEPVLGDLVGLPVSVLEDGWFTAAGEPDVPPGGLDDFGEQGEVDAAVVVLAGEPAVMAQADGLVQRLIEEDLAAACAGGAAGAGFDRAVPVAEGGPAA